MKGNYYYRPVIPLLLSLMTGIAIGYKIPGFRVYGISVMLLSAGVMGYSMGRNRMSGFAPLFLLTSAGYLMIQPWVSPFFPSHHITRFINTHSWNITGEVDDKPVFRNHLTTFILKTRHIDDGTTGYDVTGDIRVSVPGNHTDISCGNRIAVSGKLKPFRNFNNPGGFDYEGYMKFKRIWASVYAPSGNIHTVDQCPPGGMRGMLHRLRQKTGLRIDAASLEGENQILKALILGETREISPSLRDAFNRCGIGHLLAISGLHIGVIAMVSFLGVRWLLSHIRWFLWNAWVEKAAAVAAMFPVIGYGVVAGMSPSTQRAVIMVCVFLTAIWMERDQEPVNTLAIAAMVILILHPAALFSVSFQLSFSAVLAIIIGMSQIDPFIRSASNRSKTGVKLLRYALVTVLAIAGTAPLLMRYFNQISVIGLVVNLIVVPVVGSFIVPVGLMSMILCPVSESCSTVLLNIGAGILRFVIDMVTWCSDLPFAAMNTVTPTIFEIALYYLAGWAMLRTVAGCLAATERTTCISGRVSGSCREQSGSDITGASQIPAIGSRYANLGQLTTNRFSGQRFMIWVWAVIVVAGCVDVCYYLNKRFLTDELQVTILDVGQGSAALIEFPGGYNMMIDGGGFPDNSLFDIGARVIAPSLWWKKISTIHTLIVSHPDSDHLNGLLYIANQFHPKEIWTNGEAPGTQGFRQFMEIRDRRHIDLPDYRNFQRDHVIGDVHIKILYPPKEFLKLSETDKWRNVNNNSMVIKVIYGTMSILFPGDISTRAEKELIRIAGKDLQSTVLVAPHHGSGSSSSREFLEQVNPDVVIISGNISRYHTSPHPGTIRRYRQQGCRVFSTRRHGAITLVTDGQTVQMDSYRSSPGCEGENAPASRPEPCQIPETRETGSVQHLIQEKT